MQMLKSGPLFTYANSCMFPNLLYYNSSHFVCVLPQISDRAQKDLFHRIQRSERLVLVYEKEKPQVALRNPIKMPGFDAVCVLLTFTIPSFLHALLETLRECLLQFIDEWFLPFTDALAESLRVKEEAPEFRKPGSVPRETVLRPTVQHLKVKTPVRHSGLRIRSLQATLETIDDETESASKATPLPSSVPHVDATPGHLHITPASQKTEESTEPKTPIKQICLRNESPKATSDTAVDEDEFVPKRTFLRPIVPHLEGKPDGPVATWAHETDESPEPKAPVKHICLRNNSLQPTVETIDDDDDVFGPLDLHHNHTTGDQQTCLRNKSLQPTVETIDDDDVFGSHYHHHNHTTDDHPMSSANARAKRTSPEPSEIGSVRRHASRFTRDPLFPTTFDPRLDLLQPRSGFTTITEHTETDMMADEPTSTNLASPHRHAAASADNGNTTTIDTITVPKHRERAAYTAGYQQSLADQVSAQLAPSDVTYTGLYGGPAAITGRQSRFASHRLVSVPIPEDEDRIYGAIQHIGERLGDIEAAQARFGRAQARFDEDLTILSAGGPDLRARLERERRGGLGGDQAARFERLVAALGDQRARATAEAHAAIQAVEGARLDPGNEAQIQEGLARIDRATAALRAALEQSALAKGLAPVFVEN